MKSPHATLMQDDRAKAQDWGRCFSAHYMSHKQAGDASFQLMFPSICLPSVGWGTLCSSAGGSKRGCGTQEREQRMTPGVRERAKKRPQGMS